MDICSVYTVEYTVKTETKPFMPRFLAKLLHVPDFILSSVYYPNSQQVIPLFLLCFLVAVIVMLLHVCSLITLWPLIAFPCVSPRAVPCHYTFHHTTINCFILFAILRKPKSSTKVHTKRLVESSYMCFLFCTFC